MKKNIENLSGKQVTAAIRTAEGIRAKDIALEVAVTPQTIAIWRRDPIFQALVNSIKKQRIRLARDRVHGLAGKAAAVLDKLLESKDDNVRLRAVRQVLTIAGLDWGRDGYMWEVGTTDPSADELQFSVQTHRNKLEPLEMAKGFGFDGHPESSDLG